MTRKILVAIAVAVVIFTALAPLCATVIPPMVVALLAATIVISVPVRQVRRDERPGILIVLSSTCRLARASLS
jgi:predicted Co/Zn/Cd cation transporter (cation efflux family)